MKDLLLCYQFDQKYYTKKGKGDPISVLVAINQLSCISLKNQKTHFGFSNIFLRMFMVRYWFITFL